MTAISFNAAASFGTSLGYKFMSSCAVILGFGRSHRVSGPLPEQAAAR